MGDSCLSLVLEDKVDPAINARCVALAEALEPLAIPGIRDIVPAYHSVTIHFDPLRLDRETLQTESIRLSETERTSLAPDRQPIAIPVSYGREAGPDLASVADFGGCSVEQVIRLHTAPVYRVYMLGFLPGFAYLGIVDRRIAMPRLDAPRVRVPAGSVGIAGTQTGIYPCDTPGGWRIIGRTVTKLFDPTRIEPFLLKAGDRVRFVAV
jgi:KipI family sensor histidine kinase inhibitor